MELFSIRIQRTFQLVSTAIGNIVMDDLLFQKFIAVVIIGRQ